MVEWQSDSVGSIFNYLSPGCRICRQGAGLVLFVTGNCVRSCFYCPLSEERRGKDAAFADEKQVECLEDMLAEARAIGALGTGITGGEPLMRLEYVLQCIRALKQEFGPLHHIHLYTGQYPDHETLRRLKDAGLDEIRFHPPISDWSNPERLKAALQEAKILGLVPGVEIPAIREAPEIIEVVREADAFINLNELEFSETNFAGLAAQGFLPEDLGCGAVGSEDIAKEHFLVQDIKVHYCPSRFKDAVQLRERLKRRAERTARPFDYVSDEGTIIFGTIEGDTKRALRILQELDVPEETYFCQKERIDIDACILEDICEELKRADCALSIIEKYPLEGGLVVERIPL
ncbi:Coenzyme PQQ synthesis protein E [uncultured archaeon]|nr:Coenzyme PQQ synthesis protein E [uncultured archaeon]